MVAYLLMGAALMLGLIAAFVIGKHDAEEHLIKENNTLKAVQKNLNALVIDQRHTVAKLSHEVNSYNGLWATDQPDLIKYHSKRERFFRIGYPKDRL